MYPIENNEGSTLMFNNGRLPILFTLIIILVLLLSACGGTVAAPANEPVAETESVQQQDAAVAEHTDDQDGEESHPPETEAEDEDEDRAAAESPITGLRTFVIVPEESQASYLVDEEFLENALSKLGIEAGQKDVVGTTPEVSGQLQLNLEDLSAVLGENEFAVDLSQLTSDQDRRDNWIRENGPTFDRFPMATFTATAVSGLPDNYDEGQEIQFQVSGDLTVHEVTLPVTFDVTATLQDDTLTGVLETRRLMSDFGIDPPAFAGTLTVADEFGIRVEFTAREQS
ncbi:MAG: YceI family protein [Anaerolineaceae bacterium]|nr:MAG: YceI family protein [Anaerolineaceae bacterium]